MARTPAALLALTLCVGCHRAFACDDDQECRLDGVAGACEPDGWCSFPADDCVSGRRYGRHASAALHGRCVPVADGDSTNAVADTGASASTNVSGSDDGEASTTDDDPCNGLTPSGAIVVTEPGTVIAGRSITVDSGDGITVQGVSGVTIRDSEIHHSNGRGIFFSNADDLTIENVIVVHDGAPAAGAHGDGNQANIRGTDSERLRIDHVRVSHGSSGIELEATPAAQLSFIEGHDVRGPGKAAFVYLFESDGAVLEDFSIENPLDTGRPFNLIELFSSSDCTVRRGLMDGHNAEFGYGVHFEQTSGQHSGGLVEDVDAIRMTNGAFSCFAFGQDITFRRTRTRENICDIVSIPIENCDKPTRSGGCEPNSDAVSWSAAPGLDGISIEASSYFALCTDNLTYPGFDPEQPVGEDNENVFQLDEGDLVEQDFTLRAPIRIEACWE